MLEKLNVSVNVIAFALILFGGVLAIRNPDVGKLIISAAFGALGGAAAKSSQIPN